MSKCLLEDLYHSTLEVKSRVLPRDGRQKILAFVDKALVFESNSFSRGR
jgi:hypothetical protein